MSSDIQKLHDLCDRGAETTTAWNSLMNNLSGSATVDWEARIHFVAQAETWPEAMARSCQFVALGCADPVPHSH